MGFLNFLLEIGNTKAKTIQKVIDGDDTWLIFDHPTDNRVQYAVVFTRIRLENFKLAKPLQKYNSRLVLNVSFGIIDKDGRLSVDYVKVGHKPAIRILSIVPNIIKDFVDNERPALLIFAAKKEHGAYSSKSSLYDKFTIMGAKSSGLSYTSLDGEKGKYFLLIDTFLMNFSKKEQLLLKDEVLNKLSFIEYLRLRIKK